MYIIFQVISPYTQNNPEIALYIYLCVQTYCVITTY